MNKIYKVMYSKVKQCCVVVSEIAKSHGRHTKRSVAKSSAALTAGVLIALGSFSFEGMPVVQAADGTESMKNNDYVGANGYYWYFDEKTNQWEKYPYKISSINNNRSWQKLPNYEGGGAKEPGAVTAGLYAQAGEQTVTIGNRNAGQSKGSVFIGELDGYNDGGENNPVGMSNNYVTAVGFQSNATGWGSIAIGSNAVAKNTKETSQVVDYEGNEGTSGTVQDDNYGIKLKPPITWSSVALGYSAQAKDGNIAIGAYSDATDTSSATPYVSVGSSNLQRRITNVADGTGDTDVATVGQMNKAIESIGTTGWNLSTNGNSSSTTITSGKTVDFSPAVDGKNGTTDHKNVEISNDGSKVKISLNKNIVLGEATNGNGGSLNVYSDSTEASNLGNRVSIDGSTVSVNYGKEDGTSGTKRGVVLGVGEDYNNNAQGYIAFNNIDAKGTIGSTYLHSATDAPNDLKGRLVYSNAIDGTEYIANLDDGITFTGDVQKDVPKDYTQTPTKLDTTLNITGGAKTADDLTSGNIGVVSTPAAENADGTKTQASKLEIKLNKDLKGITSITSQTTDGTTTSGATITLGTNGTTISGGDVNVSTHKITGLKDGAADTDAATVGQMKTAIGDAKTKYYSVHEGPQIDGFITNEKNNGASTLAGLAAGYETGTAGIGSTVVGSYSGVMNTGTTSSVDLRGAASISLGTLNLNQNTDTSKTFSGVANSIIGQGNVTTNSNAAIILGAGNTITDSYRDVTIDTSKMKTDTPEELKDALQKAVPNSGAQVMAIGGGNKITSAYKTQVVGVGNTVSNTELNYVDGFNNTVTNGKSNYIIGAKNTLDSGNNNVIFGDNHKLSSKSNNVIIGSADDENKELTASNAVVIGHNADVSVDGGVAIGNGSVSTATDEEDAEGYDPVSTVTNKASTNTSATWKATTGAVSIGGVNGNTTTTRRITNLAAGFNDTDAVNVAQIKKLANIDASNIGTNLKGSDSKTAATTDEQNTNENAWGAAIGTGNVEDKNGQLVTGGTVYSALENQKKDLSVYAGWGIDIRKNNKNGNLISLQRNLGNIVKVNGERSPSVEVGRYAFILGGEFNNYRSYYNRTPLRNTKWGARGDNSVVVGGFDNLSSGRDSVELGGFLNEANGTYSSVLGGEENITKGSYSTVIGGWDNYAYGTHSTVVGGYGNVAYDNSAVIGGGGNRAGSCFDGTSISDAIAIGGAGNQAAGSSSVALGGYGANVFASGSTGIAGGSTGFEAYEALAAGYNSTVTVAKGTAIGYTATTNEKGTIAFGHDKGDTYYDGDARYFVGSGTFSRWPQKAYRVSQNFYDANGKQITEKEYMALMNPDYTWNDYNKRPYFEETYTSAYYNRLVKVADGQKAHDTVVMEQLTPYTRSDASNIGANLKTYTVGEDGETITEANATADEKKASENAWGEAIGTGKIADPDASDKETNGSQQLVTGSTVYNEVRPSKDGKYVKMSQTTGANLIALDDQVKTNTDKLSDVDSRSVKYDTKKVNDKTVVDNTKITLAGEGGTTITNLKDGANANDAATVGQLDAKISGVTYEAGDGIKYDTDADNNKTISVNKGDGLKFTEDHKLAVNTGKHLSVNTDGQIDVGDNGTVAEHDGNLVTGDTVYKALNGGMTKMIIGTPGKDGKDGKDGTPGTIGLVGPAGTNGKDGAVDITIQKGEDGKDGIKGANGVDGKNGINRIVYEDKNGKHQVATMEDGLKFAGDDGQNDATKAIAKKLNNTVDIIGGADSKKLTANNIGVNNVDGKLKIQLAQELTGITSISGSTGLNGAKITLDTNDQNISVNGGKITNVASGLSTNDGSYNANDANNAANISDVNSMISKAVTDAKGETQQDLDKKANVDASNIGTNLKGDDGKTAATEDEQKANLDKWGEAIGTGEVKDGSKQLVTGDTVYNAVKDKADKSYVDTQLNTKANTDGSNIDADKFSKKVAIGKIDDSDERAVSGKTVHEAIQTINGNIDGKANKNLDNIDDAGKNVIKDQARAAVTIDNKGLNTNVVATQDDKNHTTTYTINVEGNGKVAAKDTGLISGDTLYKEVHVDKDGSYIKAAKSVGQNLSALDSGLKTTSDLIHTNTKGDTIQIGGSSSASKIDVNGKDGKGRVITGVVSDANDPNSAANVGYVNGLTAANTQQIYRDMNSAYGRLNNNINKAAAGSNALAALHPLDYDPDDKADFAVGYGHYRNANAAAVGAFYHPNENTMVNVGVSLGNGDPGFNAGVSFKVGRGGAGREAMSKTEMAKVINSQSKEIDALKKDNADKDKRIDALEQKMAEILAKLDKNGK